LNIHISYLAHLVFGFQRTEVRFIDARVTSQVYSARWTNLRENLAEEAETGFLHWAKMFS